jgi:hypothetical protein
MVQYLLVCVVCLVTWVMGVEVLRYCWREGAMEVLGDTWQVHSICKAYGYYSQMSNVPL